MSSRTEKGVIHLKGVIPLNLTIFISSLFIAAIYFYPAVDGTSLLTERDLSVFFIPPRMLWTETLKNGEFPLWNPYFYSGHPLLATLQPGIFYPPNILLLILPFDLAFNWIIILHFALAGTFTFVLLRELNASKTGAIIGAITFMLSGYLFSVHNVLNTLLAAAWLPMAACLFMRAIKRSGYGYALSTGAVLAAMFFAGGIEVLYATTGLLFAVSVMPNLLDMRSGAEAGQTVIRKRLLLFAFAIAAFLAISAVQLIPFLELARVSTRGGITPFGGMTPFAGGLSYFEATTWSFDLKDFIQFVLPDPYGYASSDSKYWLNQSWLKTVYIGCTPPLLAIFYFADNKKKTLPFVLFFVLSLSIAMGKNNLFYQFLFAYFPFFDKFRYPVKFLIMPFLFLAISAGLGFDSFLKLVETKKMFVYRITVALLFLATLSATVLGLLVYFDSAAADFLVKSGIDFPEFNYVDINVFNAKRALFFLTVAATLVYAACASGRAKRFFPVAACLVLFTDLFFAHNGFYFMTKSADYHKKSAVMKSIEDDKGLYRVYVTPKTMREPMEVLNRKQKPELLRGHGLEKERLKGFNLEHRIFDIDGLEVMLRGDYSTLMTLLSYQERPDSSNLLSLLNVKYLISTPVVKSSEFRLKSVAGADNGNMKGFEKDGTLKVYENRRYLPRFFAVNGWHVVKNDTECLNILMSKLFDPSRTALLYKDPQIAGLVSEQKGRSQKAKSKPTASIIEVMSYESNRIRLKASMPSPGILVASESYYPGWKAYVDGVETEILKTDYVLRGVALGKGAHTVEFVYRPASFYAGAGISLIGLTGIFAFVCVGRRTGLSPGNGKDDGKNIQ